MAKADLTTQASASALADLTGVAIRKAHGKMALAADVLDVHEAHLGRLTKDLDLKLKHLLELGPVTLLAFGRELVDAYRDLDSPEAQAHRDVTEIRARLASLEQFIEYRRTA